MIVIGHRFPTVHHIGIAQVLHSHTFDTSSLMFKRDITHCTCQSIEATKVRSKSFLLKIISESLILALPEQTVPTCFTRTLYLIVYHLDARRSRYGTLFTAQINFRTVAGVHNIVFRTFIIILNPGFRTSGTVIIIPSFPIQSSIKR